MKKIDIDSWNRKEHYNFFSNMKSPFFGIVSRVDCTISYENAKKNKISFFADYFYKSMKAVNSIKEFKYRIIDNQVYEFDIIHAGSTVIREDGTFGFMYVEFQDDFDKFSSDIKKEILKVKNSKGLCISNDELNKNLIRHSVLPWLYFTSILHPTNFDKIESVPKIVFGKFIEENGRKFMPVSVEAHHGLLDGFHVSMYFEEFQRLLNS
jgi:chloramphenicol O-acetyltransferase type A